MGGINTGLNNALTGMGDSSKVVLGLILGGMMSIDMGGPFNKAAYVFGTASIAAGNYDTVSYTHLDVYKRQVYAGEKVGTYLKCIAPLTTRKNERIRGKEEEVPRLEAGNEASVVLELKDGAFQMLLTGDLEGRGEEQLVESGALESCPILKAGHHGSKNSGSEEFLQIVKPRLTLISAGIERCV